MSEVPSRTDPALRAMFDLAEHLTGGRNIPADSRALLHDAVNDYIASGFKIPFHTALGLRTWGGTSPEKRIRLARRDRCIRELKYAVPEWASLSAPELAKAMSKSADRYQSDRWPRDRNSLSAPSVEPTATWWRILRSGEKVPGEKMLLKILLLEIQDGV